MASGLRRSFKEKAKERLTFGFGSSRRSNPDVSLASVDDDTARGRPVSEPLPHVLLFDDPAATTALCDPITVTSPARDKPDTRSGENARTERCRSIHMTQPKGTIIHEAGGRDTLASIAAQFDTTTSELKKLNKLMTTMVFPGQIVYVPDKDYIASETSSPTSPTGPVSPDPFTLLDKPTTPSPPPPGGSTSPDTKTEAHTAFETLKRMILVGKDLKLKRRPKGPGLAQRSSEPTSPAHIPHPSDDEVRRLDEERFIKVSAKYITDGQGVVSGVLLVTPNAIMFDPNVSDPLVVDRGAEEYGMIAPMDTVISAAMYHDIAAMNREHRMMGTNGGKPPAVYHDKTCPLYPAEACSAAGSVWATFPQTRSISPSAVQSRSPAPVSPGSSEHRGMQRSESVCSCHSLDFTPAPLLKQHSMSAAPVVRASTRPPTEGFNSNNQSTGLRDTHSPEPKLTDIQEIDNVTSTDHTTSIDPENKVPSTSGEDQGVNNVKDSVVSCSDTINGYNMSVEGKALSSHSYTKTASISGSNKAYIPADSPQCAGAPLGEDTLGRTSEVDEGLPDINSLNMSDDPTGKSVKMLSPPGTVDSDDFSTVSCESVRRSPSPQREELSVPRDSCGSPRPSTSPKEHGLLTRTLESLSSLGSSFPGSPNLTSFTGLFTWNEPGMSAASLLKGQSLDDPDVFPENDPDGAEPHSCHIQRIHDQDVQVENIVKFTDKPDLFIDLKELVPLPATHYEDLPLYLCLRVGLPSNKQISKTCPIESYMKHKHKPEYWFCIPRDKVDPLYAFFLQWSPSIYGSDDEISAKDRGFVVVDETEESDTDHSDMELIDNHFDKQTPNTRQMTKDWEIVNLEEARRRLSYAELEHLALPDLSDKSAILTEAHIRRLVLHLPARAEGYPWRLIYSSEKHGFSLKTLYRTMQKIDSPVMIAIKDTNSQVFGAMLPCAIILSDHFYGTGESYLFTFFEDFKRYGWSGSNNFFIKGNAESLAIGSGKGSFGLWLDGDLYHGRTQCCETYNNDILTDTEDFVVKTLEAWGFV